MSTTPLHEPLPLRSVQLPRDLVAGIERALGSAPQTRWIDEAQALSERYRAERAGGEAALATGRAQALGYAAIILPATYAQLRGAISAAAARVPHWQPRRLLDIGSGPGTAIWAAAAQWPMLHECVAWEREPALIALGRELAGSSDTAPIRAARWERVDVTEHWPDQSEQYDLVVIGHVLNELALPVQRSVVEAAWRRTRGLLLIVEPGTSAAFRVVRAARDQLLELAAHTIAPCAHDAPCPLQTEWCHFPQRLQRPAFQRQARNAALMWEDSKFSYAAMARFSVAAPIWGRVLGDPSSNKAYAEAKVSDRGGITVYRGLKRHKAAYKNVQDWQWGGALHEKPPDPISATALERTTKPE